jgi:tRNA-intron endonuclease, archaea type
VKGTLEGNEIRLGKDARVLYDQSGYGRPEKGGEGLKLSAVEALYLLHRNRIDVAGYDMDRLLSIFTSDPLFFRSYLVYRDLRERGYAVQTGPHDFRVFRRGERPGTGQSRYMVRVLSERDLVDFGILVREFQASANMRKQHILAVVDDENELTYYEIKVQALSEVGQPVEPGPLQGVLTGRYVMVRMGTEKAGVQGQPGPLERRGDVQTGDTGGNPGLENPPNEKPGLLTPGPIEGYFGMQLDKSRIVLSALEAVYLMQSGQMSLEKEGTTITPKEYLDLIAPSDVEINEKVVVYGDLRAHGYTPKTGYKFGHHFRVYSGNKVHSEMLVHVVAADMTIPASSISRSVRLSHSVKKKMLFGCVHTTGIHYIEFARIKL